MHGIIYHTTTQIPHFIEEPQITTTYDNLKNCLISTPHNLTIYSEKFKIIIPKGTHFIPYIHKNETLCCVDTNPEIKIYNNLILSDTNIINVLLLYVVIYRNITVRYIINDIEYYGYLTCYDGNFDYINDFVLINLNKKNNKQFIKYENLVRNNYYIPNKYKKNYNVQIENTTANFNIYSDDIDINALLKDKNIVKLFENYNLYYYENENKNENENENENKNENENENKNITKSYIIINIKYCNYYELKYELFKNYKFEITQYIPNDSKRLKTQEEIYNDNDMFMNIIKHLTNKHYIYFDKLLYDENNKIYFNDDKLFL